MKEWYVRVVHDTLREAKRRVRRADGTTELLPVRVRFHQGSSLTLYLFNLLMDVLWEEAIKEAPWTM